MFDNTLQLKDKRLLGYAIYGAPDGQPVLYYHGTPSSRIEPQLLTAYNKDINTLTSKLGIRLIAIDRPGMGFSTYHPNSNFKTFSEDAIALADYLKIDKCKVLCWSGGGSFALATGYHFPTRVTSIHIIAGFSRSFSEPGVFKNMGGNKYYFGTAKLFPWLMRPIMDYVGKKKPDRSIPNWLSQLKKVDHELLENKHQLRHVAACTLNEACRINSQGLIKEAKLYYEETGFDLKKIVQPIHYWWGTEDNVVTRIHATSVEEMAPHAIMHYKTGEGHLSIYIKYMEEILETVANS